MTTEEIKNRQQIINEIDNIVNHVFCDSVCEPVCGRRKTLGGYVDNSGVPCARNSCNLFNAFADNAMKELRTIKSKL